MPDRTADLLDRCMSRLAAAREAVAVLLFALALLDAAATPAQEAAEPPVVPDMPSALPLTPPAAPPPPSAEPDAAPAAGVSEAELPVASPEIPVAETPAEPTILPHDLSPWGMFLAADIVVQSVMVGLVFASVVTWTIWLAKTIELLAAGARLRRASAAIMAAPDLAAAERALGTRGGPAAAMVRTARQEASASQGALDAGGGAGLKGRVASHLGGIEARAGRRLAMGTGLLATIGSTAPFVGLFGTVWGIMNSFIGIAASQTTNLAVVAPGIAEALLATGLGLVAAIPAVVIYNFFARWITSYRARLADAAAAVERLVSRDLDHRRLAPGPLARAAE